MKPKTPKPAHNTFTVYRDKRREWRWRLTAPNGRVLADSGEGYKRKRDCLRGLVLVSRCSFAMTEDTVNAGLKWSELERVLSSAVCAKLKFEEAKK